MSSVGWSEVILILTRRDQSLTYDFEPERFPLRYQFLHDYGALIAVWNEFEIAIEVAIMRRTGMTPLKASIVLSAIGFGHKRNILDALLKEEGREDLITKLESAINAAGRNAFVHGVPTGNKDLTEFAFARRDFKNKRYRTKPIRFTAESFREHFLNFQGQYVELAAALGVTMDDIDAYAREARFDWPKS